MFSQIIKTNILRSLVLIGMVFFTYSIKAQEDLGLPLKQVNFATPEAAMLGKFESVSVSNYTGVPDISIPLHTIKDRSFELPIVLRYHSSGIKVDEEATWVGLGWSLSVGGQVTQVPVGVSDDYEFTAIGNIANGYDNLMDFSPTYPPQEPVEPENYGYSGRTERGFLFTSCMPTPAETDDDPLTFWWIERQQLLKPDIYNYNLPTASGKFYLTPFNNVPTLCGSISSKDKITRKTTANMTSGWIIADMHGNIYTFKPEHRGRTKPNSANDVMHSSSTWNMSNIHLPWGNSIDFTYIDAYSRKMGTSDNLSSSATAMNAPYYLNTPITVNEHHSKHLSQIETVNERIVFTLSSNRPDLMPSPTTAGQANLSKRLDAIHIYDKINNRLIKSYEFTYGFFVGSHSTGDPEYNYKRLKLISIKEIGYNAAGDPVEMPPYEFEYNSTQLPGKDSRAVDHWGYYNGKVNNEVYLPDLSLYCNSGLIQNYYSYDLPLQRLILDNQATTGSTTYDKANRGMDPSYAQAAILTKITYPTGGYRQFSYEPNEFSNFVVFSAYEEQYKQGFYSSGQVGDYNYVEIPGQTCGQAPRIGGYMLPDSNGEIKLFDIFVEIDAYDPSVTYNDIYSSYVKLMKEDASGQKSAIKTWDLGEKESEFNNNGKVEWNLYYYEYEGEPTDKYYFEAFLVSNTVIPMGVCGPNFTPKAGVFADFKWIDPSKSKPSSIGGGMRIASQESFQADDTPVNKLAYSYVDKNGNTSGKLMTPLNYISYRNIRRKERVHIYNGPIQPPTYHISDYFEYTFSMSSNSYIPLAYDASGAVVGYSRVTVSEIDLSDTPSNGTSIYYYKNKPTKYFESSFDVPNVPFVSNGLVDSVVIENAAGDIQKRIKNEYFRQDNDAFYGVTIRDNYIGPDQCEGYINPYAYSGRANVIYYPIISTIYVQSKSIEIEYYDGAEPLITERDMLYNNYGLLAESSETNSEGQNLLKTFKYCVTEGPSGMNNQNYISPVIHEEHFVNSNKVFDKYVNYESFTGLYDDVFLYYMVNLNGTWVSVPYRTNVYLPTYATAYTSNASKYMRVDHEYDASNLTLVEYSKEHDIPIAYVWGYNDQYPIAQIVGIEHSALTTAQINKIKELDNSGINLNQVNSEIRNLLPGDCMVSTYTYKPLVGMTSQTGPDGRTVYYEYDDNGRLETVKDHDGKVLRHTDYHFAE